MRSWASFTLAGLIGGLVVGALDGPAAAASAGSLGAAGVVGLDALLGGAFGFIAGVLHPAVPQRLRPLTLVRHALARLRPGDQDALHDRCRTVTGLWLAALGLPGLLLLLHLSEPLLLDRIRSRLLAALAVALLGLALTGLTLALVAPLLAGVARGLETLVRRRPALTAVTRPDANLVLAALAGVAVWWATRPAGGLGLALEPLIAVLALPTVTLLGGEWALRLGRGLTAVALVVVLGGAAALAGVGLRVPATRAALIETPALGLFLRAARPISSPTEPGA